MLGRRDSSVERVTRVFLDLLALFIALNLAFDLRYYVDWTFLLDEYADAPAPWAELYHAVPYMLLAWFVSFSIFGLYGSFLSWRKEVTQIAKAELTAFVMIFATAFFYRGFSFSRGAALFLVPLAFVLTVAFRRLFIWSKQNLMKLKAIQEHLLLVGWTEEAQTLVRRIQQPDNPFQAAGLLADDQQTVVQGVQRLGAPNELGKVLTRESFDRVLLISAALNREELKQAIDTCLRHRVAWAVVPDLYDLLLDRLRMETIAGIPVMGPKGSNIVGLNMLVKRVTDLLAASLMVLLLSPLLGLIALLVKLSSQGPVLFVQKRVGRGGQTFSFYKYRSMVAGGKEREHKEVMAQVIKEGKPVEQDGDAPVYKKKDDPRITRVGKFIRRFSLDELPQLFNVLKGDMSLIGPRPAIPYEVAMYNDWHRRRLEVLPGITGLWQVSGRNKLSFEEMVTLDIQYIENWTLGMDIRIAFKTLVAVLLYRGY